VRESIGELAQNIRVARVTLAVIRAGRMLDPEVCLEKVGR